MCYISRISKIYENKDMKILVLINTTILPTLGLYKISDKQFLSIKKNHR